MERAVNISLVTTRELIQKDFAFEKDEIKYKNAANLCIKSLAGSLAMVTCREPLRIGFNNQLKETLGKKGFEIDNILESIYNSQNNIEILDSPRGNLNVHSFDFISCLIFQRFSTIKDQQHSNTFEY